MKKKINIIILGKGRQAKFYKKILCKKKHVNLINNKSKNYNFKESIKGKIDLAIVADATPVHYKILNFLLSKDINILCEKPFCSNYQQAYKIYKKSKKYKKLFFLNYQFRFESHIQFIKKLIISKKLGKITSVKIDWSTNQKKLAERLYSFKNSFKSGGVLKEFASHVIDYCKWIFDNDLFVNNSFAKNNIKYLKNKDGVLKKCSGFDYCEVFLKNGLDINIFIKINNFGKKAYHNIYLEGDNSFCSIIHNHPFHDKNIKIVYKFKNKKKVFYKYFYNCQNSRILSTNKILSKIILAIKNNNNNNLLPNFKDGLYVHKIIKNIYNENRKSV